MKKKIIYGVVMVLIFIAGRGSVGNATAQEVSMQPKTVTKTVYVTQAPQVITKTVQPDLTNWQALKAIDENGFNTSADIVGQIQPIASTCADAITATENGDNVELANDTATIEGITTKINNDTADLTQEVSQRKAILSKLGY